MHRLIPVINAVVLSVFTVGAIRDSFSLFIMFMVILAAVGLIFMRRKTPHDRFYVRSALVTTVLCMISYCAYGIVASSQNTSDLSFVTFIIFAPIVLPAYLSTGYALAMAVYRPKKSA